MLAAGNPCLTMNKAFYGTVLQGGSKSEVSFRLSTEWNAVHKVLREATLYAKIR